MWKRRESRRESKEDTGGLTREDKRRGALPPRQRANRQSGSSPHPRSVVVITHRCTHKQKVSQPRLHLDPILDTVIDIGVVRGKRKEEKTPATHAQLDVAREVLDPLVLVQRALDKGRGDDALFAVHTSDDRVGEQGSGCDGSTGSLVVGCGGEDHGGESGKDVRRRSEEVSLKQLLICSENSVLMNVP